MAPTGPMKSWKNVDEYIAAAPKGAQPKLREVRAAIRDVAPKAVESISYGMAFYSYKGKSGIKGRLCYFGLHTSHIGLYLLPPVIGEHLGELAGYKTTKSAVHLPLDRPIPVSLIKNLVRDGMRRHDAREDDETEKRRAALAATRLDRVHSRRHP